MTTGEIENVPSQNQEPHPLEEMPSFEEHMSELAKAKTWQEKAKEKNYYQDENGDWWEKSDIGWGDENVSSFKLDIEYPELADVVEKSAEANGVQIYDSNLGLKQEIYNRAETLSKYGPDTINSMFVILNGITRSMSGTEETILSRSEEDTKKSLEKLEQYYSGLSDEARQAGVGRYSGAIAETFIRDYSENLATDSFMEQLSRGASIAQTDPNIGHKLAESIRWGIGGFAKNDCDGDLFSDYLDYALELLPDDEKVTKYDDKLRVFQLYVAQHGFKEDTVDGFKNIVFPMIEKHDPEVEAIVNGGNAYGTGEYDYGIADYTEECLLSKYTPQNIDRLNRIYHEIPTSSYQKFEQNRQDAGRLQGVIIGGRDFIHDERPGVHEILSTMEEYYDAETPESREEIRGRLVELDQKYPYAGFLENALDLENYDKTVENMSEYHLSKEMVGKTDGRSDERAIDILRRLVKNTSPEEIEAPKTQYEELNQLMNNIDPVINSETGEVKVSLDEIAPAVTELNKILVENQGQQGVFPSTVSAVAYLDKMSSNVLRGLDKKEISEIIYDPKFKEILRFSQLTSSTGYNESEFESFYQQARDKFSKAYGEDGVDPDEIRNGWRFVGDKTTANMAALAKNYGAHKSTDRFVGAVWSGNLSHELIGAFERV